MAHLADAMRATFGPIERVPTVVDSTASTTPAVLTADLSGDTDRIRSIIIANTASSGTIALLFVAKGASLSGLDVTDGLKIPAGQFRTVPVSSALRVGIVADGASVAYNAVVSDT